MPQDIPKPLDPTRVCNACAHWLYADRARMIVNPETGNMRPSAIENLGNMKPGEIAVHVAACTIDPVWTNSPAHHWCGQFSRRVDA